MNGITWLRGKYVIYLRGSSDRSRVLGHSKLGCLRQYAPHHWLTLHPEWKTKIEKKKRFPQHYCSKYFIDWVICLFVFCFVLFMFFCHSFFLLAYFPFTHRADPLQLREVFEQTWRQKKQWYTEDDFSKSTH